MQRGLAHGRLRPADFAELHHEVSGAGRDIGRRRQGFPPVERRQRFVRAQGFVTAKSVAVAHLGIVRRKRQGLLQQRPCSFVIVPPDVGECYVVVEVRGIRPHRSRPRKGIQRLIDPIIAAARGADIHPVQGLRGLKIGELKIDLFGLAVLGLHVQRVSQGLQYGEIVGIGGERLPRSVFRLCGLVPAQMLD